eukprot:1670861-Pyramimonas_sp.AAC.2
MWTATGRRMLPPLQLDADVAFLSAGAHHRLLAATATGALHLWDLERQRCLLVDSLQPALAAAAVAGTTGKGKWGAT